MCLSSLYDLHSPESDHQQRQDDICELHQSHWQVNGQQMKDLGGVSFDKYRWQKKHPKNGQPDYPNHSQPFRLPCQDQEQDHNETLGTTEEKVRCHCP